MTLHALVFNPASGRRLRGARTEQIAAVFRADGHAVRLLPTERPGHASDIVEALLRDHGGDPVDVLALGGDGTLNEVLLGGLRAGALRGAGSPLRIAALPGGTTNVVARSLGLPREPLAAARALRSANERLLDVGTCRIHAQKRPFLLACGIGFDAEVLELVSPLLKRVLGQEAYRLAALRGVGERHRGLVADLELEDGGRERFACESLVAGASTLYAGSLRLSRRARPDDGLLEVALLASTRLFPMLRAAWHAGRGAMEDAPGVRVVQARSLRVSARIEVPVHVDAEVMGSLPCEVGVMPLALRMRVP